MPVWWTHFLFRTGLHQWLPRWRRELSGLEPHLHRLNHSLLSLPLAELRDDAIFPDVQSSDIINLALDHPPRSYFGHPGRGAHDARFDPRGWLELREAISRLEEEEAGYRPDPRRELLTAAGSEGAFAAFLDAFVNPGDGVVILDPTSPVHSLALKHRRAHIRFLPTWLDNGKLRFEATKLRNLLRGAKALILPDPVVPNGGVICREDLEQISFWAKKCDCLIYRDETLAGFRYDEPRVSLASLPHCADRSVSVGSIAERFGLPGVRVGWLTGPRSLVEPCLAAAAMHGNWCSGFDQQLALQALQSSKEKQLDVKEELKQRRQYAFDRLKLIGLDPTWPGGGFSCWINVSQFGISGREFARQLLLEKRVLVNVGEIYGPSGKNCIRLSFAADEGRLREGLHRLTEFVNERAAVVKPESTVAAQR